MRIFASIFVLVAVCASAAAQGGKAEPRRVVITEGSRGLTLAGSLANGQEMEYVFRAPRGRTVTVQNATTNLFDVRIFNEEGDVETEFDSSRRFTVNTPIEGDYLVFVRKKQVRSPRTARFSVKITIN